jgi:hypothetical protein
MSDLMADYERVIGMLRRAGVPFTSSKTHEVVTVGGERETTLWFNSRGALVRWETRQPSDTPESEPPHTEDP